MIVSKKSLEIVNVDFVDFVNFEYVITLKQQFYILF